jgi:hypothetical protein
MCAKMVCKIKVAIVTPQIYNAVPTILKLKEYHFVNEVVNMD